MTDNDKAYDEAKLAFLAAAYVYCDSINRGITYDRAESMDSMMKKWATWEAERQKYMAETLEAVR